MGLFFDACVTSSLVCIYTLVLVHMIAQDVKDIVFHLIDVRSWNPHHSLVSKCCVYISLHEEEGKHFLIQGTIYAAS